MYTSYFGNIDNIDETEQISISSRNPNGYKGGKYFPLAPHPSFLVPYLKGRTTKEQYTESYKTLILDVLDPEEVYKHLLVIGGENACLLCYEQPGEFCHRRLVADWFKEKLGIDIPEKV